MSGARTTSRGNTALGLRPHERASQGDAAGEDILFRILGSGGLLLDARTQRIHRLDAATAVMWCAHAEGLDAAAVLADRSDVTPEEARRLFERSLAEWRRLGLLTGARAPPAPRLPPAPGPGKGVRPPSADAVTCRLLGNGFAVVTPDRAVAESLAGLIGHLAEPCDLVQDVLTIRSTPGGYVLDGEPEAAPCPIKAVGPLVQARLTLRALDRAEGWAAVHAACVARAGKAVLLPAPQGSGKSTLAAALALGGLELVSDDTVVAGDDPLVVHPLPTAICLKQGSWDVLAGLWPGLREAPVLIRPDGLPARYLRPPRVARSAVELAAIVVPARQAGHEPRLHTMDEAAAAAALVPELYPLANRWQGADLDRLRRLLTQVPAWRLDYDEVGAAAALVSRMLDG